MQPPRRTRQPGEFVFILLLLAGSAFLLWSSYGISGFSSTTSAGAFPMAAAAVMVVCALVSLVQTWRLQREPREPGEGTAGQFLRRVMPPVVIWLLAVLVAYMLSMERIGFVPSSYLFLVVGMRLLGERRWLLNLAVSALALAAIYVVFKVAFTVVLPTGSLWQGLLP
jgi:putative tricarboxylic transport membrane protein